MISVNDVANILDGRDYPLQIESALADEIRAAGIVIVYGQSDDLMEFAGAISDKAGCYEGGEVLFDRRGLLGERPDDGTDEELLAWLNRKSSARCIEAVWNGDADDPKPCWTYETDIPCRAFDVIEDGNVYCTGIVFSVADL